ncbi:NAD-binding protein [Suillus subluteus]|nr:NAD-binding protein [Suillus subluteus]
MSGKVVLVTGANSGIGKQTARPLTFLIKNAKVYVACRDKTKGEDAIRDLKESTGKEACFLQLNLANLKSVSGEEFMRREPVLFNNALDYNTFKDSPATKKKSAMSLDSNMVFHDVSFGALTQLYARTTAEGANLNGKHLIPWARIGNTHPDAHPQQASELWNWLEEQVKDL